MEGVLYIEIPSSSWIQLYCIISKGHDNDRLELTGYQALRKNLEVSSLNKDREPFLHFYLDDVYDCILKTLSLSERRKEESKGLPIESVHLQLNTKVSSIYIQSLENELDNIRIAVKNDIERKKWSSSLKQNIKKNDEKSNNNNNNLNFEFNDVYMKKSTSPSPRLKIKETLEMTSSSSKKISTKTKQDDVKEPIDILPFDESKGTAVSVQNKVCKDLMNKSLDDHIKEIQTSHSKFDKKKPATESKCYKLFCSKCRKVNNNNNGAFDSTIDTDKDNDSNMKLCGLVRLETLYEFLKIVSSFPFTLVISGMSTKSLLIPPIPIIVMINAIIYVVPFILFTFLLKKYPMLFTEQVVLGVYTSFYVLPALYSIILKLWLYRSTKVTDTDLLCIRPSTTLRFSISNCMSILGMGIEWIQHSAFVLPLDVVTPLGNHVTSVQYPPYLSVTVYTWFAIASAFLCGLALILRGSFRGKVAYFFNNSRVIWSLIYLVSYPLFLSMMTVLYMVFKCDKDGFINQDTNIECYNAVHKKLCICAFIAIAVILLQSTLLPSGSYIETSSNINLDINFPPIYLQVECILKAFFAFVYVFFYDYNYVRIPILTFINIFLMLINGVYGPCCITWINIVKCTIYIHGSIVGIQSLNYVFWQATANKTLMLTTLSSNCFCIAFTMFLYCRHTRRSADMQVKQSFIQLECDELHSNKVSPRVLEPLIARSLCKDSSRWDAVKSFIPKLSYLICFPDNMRVQFLACWALSNITKLDEDSRQQIITSKAIKFIHENYDSFDSSIELQSLAIIANLAVSYRFSSPDFVKYNFVPFLLELVVSNKYKHSIFATVAIGNIARDENLRQIIVQSGGIQALAKCILSNDYEKKRYGCLALGNITLSLSEEILNILDSDKFMRCVIKIAVRTDVTGHKEALCLLRNMCGHTRLRSILVERLSINSIIKKCRSGSNQDIKKLCDEILKLTSREKTKEKDGRGLAELQMKLNVGGGDKYKIGGKETFTVMSDGELLKKMTPLCGQVDSFMFDSKINDIFKYIVNPLPKLHSEVKLHVKFETSTTLYFGAGIEDRDRRWYDRLRYSVEVNPSNGDLNEVTDETAIYTPNKNFNGADLIVIRVMIDDLSYSKMKIILDVSSEITDEGKEGDDDESDDYERKSSLCFCCNRNNSNTTIIEKRNSQDDGNNGDDDDDDSNEYQSEDQADNEYQDDDGSNRDEERV